MNAKTQRHQFARGTVDVIEAWTPAEVRAAVRQALDGRALPANPHARIVLKPNLNNDLPALTGNSTDLRVLCALIEALQERGYTDLCVADGPNVGVERRGIDVFGRLRVRAMTDLYGVKLVDLNRAAASPVLLHSGGHPHVANLILDADYVISVPTIKTHAEVQLSCACKNWVGICRAQDKRHMHLDLGRNIATLVAVVRPDLVLVDGLVGMEGNGPGDGTPYRLGLILAADDPWLCDLVACRLLDLPWGDVSYLAHGRDTGHLSEADADAVAEAIEVRRPVEPPPARAPLAMISELPALEWLKRAVRPLTQTQAVTDAAYRAGVIQDVYSLDDDGHGAPVRDPSACGDCTRCEDFCPTGLDLATIGTERPDLRCIECLYCWWVCPNDAMALEGEHGFMERPAQRYKGQIEAL